MRNPSTKLVAAFLGLCLVSVPLLVFAADETEKKTASVSDLSWMAGNWTGKLFGGLLNERWTKPVGGTMLGMSRIGDDPHHSTYELLLLEQVDDDVYMFLRHFKSALATNERAPMKFQLTKLTKKSAVFESDDKKLQFTKISYHRRKNDTLLVKLEGGTPEKPVLIQSEMKRSSD